MGCDIHVYIEYKNRKIESDGHKHNWLSHGGRINPGRNYALFALMANVRNYGGDLPVTFDPRGMPDDVAYYASGDDRMYICEDEGDNYVKMERAERWVKDGSSKFIYDRDGKPTWVTHPDWHSHSWLTTSEFESIFNNYLERETQWHKERVADHMTFVKRENIKPDSWAYEPPSMNVEPTYQAVLASMKRFEELNYDSRIVFWFDN